MIDNPELLTVEREYRKTATIKARQWWQMGDHPAVELASDVTEAIRKGEPVPFIFTMEGGYVVTPGDWIATGIHGEHWAIKPDIFAATYEPVEPPMDFGEAIDPNASHNRRHHSATRLQPSPREAIQLDRDAAADLTMALSGGRAGASTIAEFRNGARDTSPTVQAFARHRLQPSPVDVERLAQELRERTRFPSGQPRISPEKALEIAAASLAALQPASGQEGAERLTSDAYEPGDMGPIGGAARRVASWAEGQSRLNVYKAAKRELTALRPADRGSDWFAGDVDCDGNELTTIRVDELQKLRDEREKFMWQVRDTCTRAEKAEAALADRGDEVGRIVEWLLKEASEYQSPLYGEALLRAAQSIKRGDYKQESGR